MREKRFTVAGSIILLSGMVALVAGLFTHKILQLAPGVLFIVVGLFFILKKGKKWKAHPIDHQEE